MEKFLENYNFYLNNYIKINSADVILTSSTLFALTFQKVVLEILGVYYKNTISKNIGWYAGVCIVKGAGTFISNIFVAVVKNLLLRLSAEILNFFSYTVNCNNTSITLMIWNTLNKNKHLIKETIE